MSTSLPISLPRSLSSTPKSDPASRAKFPVPYVRACARALAFCAALLLALLFFLFLPDAAHAQDAVHTVARGEHLSQIARHYGVDVVDLISYNELDDPNHIWTGQRLLIPGVNTESAVNYGTPADPEALPAGNGYYTVRQGDTLSEIAARYGIDANDLMRMNGLTNAGFVWVGQQLRLSTRVEPGVGVVDQTERSDISSNIYVVQPGDTLSQIAKEHGTTMQDLLAANGLPNANFVWVGQQLRIKSNASVAVEAMQNAPADGRRWIDVNLTDQTLTAWQGNVAIMYTSISSGLPGTPTVTGQFQVGIKYQSQRMVGPGYDLPGVPWVMYFYGDYAIHGAYWHNNFGVPMSRGCVNMVPAEAEFLYNWAAVGTEVYVHY